MFLKTVRKNNRHIKYNTSFIVIYNIIIIEFLILFLKNKLKSNCFEYKFLITLFTIKYL